MKVCHFREDFLCERKLSFSSSSSCSIFLRPIDYEDENENEDDSGPLVPAEPAWGQAHLTIIRIELNVAGGSRSAIRRLAHFT